MTDNSGKRRESPRHRVRECMLCYKEGLLSSIFGPAKAFPVSDISRSGLCYVSNKEHAKGDIIKLSLDIPAFVKPLKIEALVMWCVKMEGYDNYFRVGVMYHKMSKDTEKKLQRLDDDVMLHHVRRDPHKK